MKATYFLPKFLVMLFASVCLATINALSVSATSTDTLLLTEVQVRSEQDSAQEFIEIFNASDQAQDVSNWRIEYLTSSGSASLLASLQGELSGRQFLLLSKSGYLQDADAYFTKSLSDTGGHLRIVNAAGVEIDRIGWGSAQFAHVSAPAVPAKGLSLQRAHTPEGFVNTQNNNVDFSAATPSPQGGGLRQIPVEEAPAQSPCSGVVLSEIFANPPGADSSGGEFVEVMNTSTERVYLAGCTLQTDKMAAYPLSADAFLEPKQYLALYFADKLLNGGGNVTLAGSETEETVTYPALTENQTWAKVNNVWQVTHQPTPDMENVALADVAANTILCPEGKALNPDTGRCKTLLASTVAECKPGQVRNPETNRCRTVVAAASTDKSCPAGQVRNASTNRCRKISSDSEAKACPDGYTRNSETKRCRKDAPVLANASTDDSPTNTATAQKVNMGIIGLVVACVVGYMLYEYRHDMGQKMRRVVRKLPFIKNGEAMKV